LILSYLVVIAVCLALVGLAALVLLRGYQRNLAYNRLVERSGLAARLATESMHRGMSPQETVDRLAEQMNRGNASPVSVHLLDTTGLVVVGSDDRLHGQRFEELSIGPTPPLSWAEQGERRLGNGEFLLYAAELVRIRTGELQRRSIHILLLSQVYHPARFVLGDLMPRLIWAGALALALSIVVAAVIAYSIARPLDRIAGAAEQIAAGNYEQQLDITTPTEVARLAKSFNSMAHKVKTALQSQRDLVANVSHELKTPLTSIQGFSQALLDGTANDAAGQERAATIVYEEAGRMRRLVDDLLELARLEGGQITIAQEPVGVGKLLRGYGDRFAPQAEQSGVTLEIEVPTGPIQVTGDEDRLGQVFGNLVDNALKHAQNAVDGGRVVLRAEVRDGQVLCSVTDNGPGIPAEDLSRVFERFYQVDKSRARRGSGAGLGLAISQEIVHAHGGQIRVESVEDLGTRFTVEFPDWHDGN
jgi:signal transduction histidine kinase